MLSTSDETSSRSRLNSNSKKFVAVAGTMLVAAACFVFVINSTVNVSGQIGQRADRNVATKALASVSVSGHFHFDNIGEAYVGGVLVASSSYWPLGASFSTMVEVPGVVLMKVTDIGTVAGMLGQFTVDGHEYPTNNEWMCARGFEESWLTTGVQGGAPADLLAKNGDASIWNAVAGGPRPQVALDGWWIWSGNNNYIPGGVNTVSCSRAFDLPRPPCAQAPVLNSAVAECGLNGWVRFTWTAAQPLANFRVVASNAPGCVISYPQGATYTMPNQETTLSGTDYTSIKFECESGPATITNLIITYDDGCEATIEGVQITQPVIEGLTLDSAVAYSALGSGDWVHFKFTTATPLENARLTVADYPEDCTVTYPSGPTYPVNSPYSMPNRESTLSNTDFFGVHFLCASSRPAFPVTVSVSHDGGCMDVPVNVECRPDPFTLVAAQAKCTNSDWVHFKFTSTEKVHEARLTVVELPADCTAHYPEGPTYVAPFQYSKPYRESTFRRGADYFGVRIECATTTYDYPVTVEIKAGGCSFRRTATVVNAPSPLTLVGVRTPETSGQGWCSYDFTTTEALPNVHVTAVAPTCTVVSYATNTVTHAGPSLDSDLVPGTPDYASVRYQGCSELPAPGPVTLTAKWGSSCSATFETTTCVPTAVPTPVVETP